MARIIIMDDEIALAHYWRQILQEAGHQVVCCRSVDQCLKHLANNAFDLIIADMIIRAPQDFPDKGGITLVGKRVTGAIPLIPILGVSGFRPKPPHYDQSPLQFAKDMGIELALYKPITPEELLLAVNKLLPTSPSNRSQ
jgi:CheY-like chemotaxis protein